MMKQIRLVWTIGLAAVMPVMMTTAWASDYTYTLNANNTLTITGYTGAGGDVAIPDKIDGRVVTVIGNDAFDSYTELTSVTIPDSVTSIGRSAFNGCTGVTSITIPDGVISIWDGAFCGCAGLTNITIPNGILQIRHYTFKGCAGLTNITIPDSVIAILDLAFEGCAGLTNITIPDDVMSIGASAFEGCTRVSTVILGIDLNSIGNYVFKNCPILTGVYCKGNTPHDAVGVFEESLNVTVYYLSGTVGWAPTFCNRPTALWEITPAAIVIHPQSQAQDIGESANFSVTATGTAPLYYQWQKDGVNVDLANSAAYSIASVTFADAGQYRCIVSNMANSVTSTVALLRISEPDPDLGPSIRANDQRGTVTVDQGEPITISITMAAGAYIGTNADWWVIAIPSYGANWYYLNTLMQWSEFPANDLTAPQPAYQGPLMDVQNPVTLLSNATLMLGTYLFYFAVDQMDGILNYPNGPILVDSVTVTVE